MHIKGKNSWIKHLDFILISLFSIIVAFLLAYSIKFKNIYFYSNNEWATMLLILCLVNLLITLVMNPYSGIFRRAYYEDAVKLGLLTIYMFVTVGILFYSFKIGAIYSRITIVLTFVFYYIISFVLVLLRKKMLLSGIIKGIINRKRKLFIVTEFENIDRTIENALANDIDEYEIEGYCFSDKQLFDGKYKGYNVLTADKVADYIITNHFDDIFICTNPSILSPASYKKIIENELTIHINLESLIGTEGDDQFISRIGVYKAASIGPYTFDLNKMWYFVVKRVFDFFAGLFGCLLLLPLTVVVKTLYMFSGDFSPIFYSQVRVGRYGKTFKLYKFRTMVPNADIILQDLLKQEIYRMQWDENQKLDKDPRITKVGGIMRRLSLDEAPQFLNLVKGDMSLIGPRPLVVGELEEHNGLALYNKVKPGITGWWACNGRSNINYRERLELEYYYVKNCSLHLDVLCIVRTIIAVLKKEGAQ